MAKEGTVAPKERVNIVYRPATGDAQEEVELPLKKAQFLIQIELNNHYYSNHNRYILNNLNKSSLLKHNY